MRIAHIILAHKNPKQLSRLIKRLSHSSFDFYIHLDKKNSLESFEFLGNLNNVSFIKNRIKCNWGGNSLSTGILSSLEEVVKSDHHYDFINLISGQDYPIESADDIYGYFKDKKGFNYISYDEDKNSNWSKLASRRYEKYHFTDFDFKAKYFFERIFNLLTPKRKFPSSFEVFGGSKATWWTITGECASDILIIYKENTKLQNFLKYCWGTDELIIPTLILNSKHKSKTINNNLRYIDWSEGNAHPKTLGIEDYDKIKSSNNLFARKFDLDFDHTILEKIDISIKESEKLNINNKNEN